MRVRILGPVDVLVDGVPREVRGFRRKAVLAVLALRAGEIVSTDRLIDAVWGDTTPATVRNTLQSHISHLRGVLGDRTAIAARAPGYVLDAGAEETDLQLAQRHIEQGKQAADPATSAFHLRAALALWRDRPLVDVAGLPWLDDQAERLAKIHLEVIEALTEARLALGEHVQLVTDLDQLSEQHPFHERIHEQLTLALYRAGRQADALAVCRRIRCSLNEQLGVDPGPALRALEAAVLRQDPALDLPEPAVTSTAAVTGAATHIRFCVTPSGGRIAYTARGSGEPLVVPAAWIATLEPGSQDPALRAFEAPISADRMLVQYDAPGCGLSDPWPVPWSLDAEIEVLGAVADELGLDRFALFGVSSAAPTALAFTARNPDRVSRLIIYGGYADGTRIASAEVRTAMVDLIRAHWGLGSDLLADIFMPDADSATRRRFAHLQRTSASAATAAEMLASCHGHRVTDLLDQVVAPTLILHRRDDRAIPHHLGRELAARIRGARFVTLSGRDHLPYVGDASAIADAVVAFLADNGSSPLPRTASRG
ncbi:alpha/beta fold hydrolase [Amycolatopsis lurida]